MAVRKHKYPPKELDLPRTLHSDRHKLENRNTDVPIITISASFRSDIENIQGEKASMAGDVVFSRAHYSMAQAVLKQAERQGLRAWLADPTNYVSRADWRKVVFVEKVGKLTARIPLLKTLKDLVDSFARSKFPIRDAITKPLIYLTEKISKPIISMHYESGNILVAEGKKVVQVITDPHVRPHYLAYAEKKDIVFAVFDEKTKSDFFKIAKLLKKEVDEERVVVTGPPIDPRIIDARKGKDIKHKNLNLVIATSGLGTNLNEIEEIVDSLLPKVREKDMSLILYASTHEDFRDLFYKLATKHGVEIGDIDSSKNVRVIYSASIVEANEELIKYAFPWAHGFITKPSGDMAYDAVAAGCFLLTLDPWGEWEVNIEKIFSNLDISKKADAKNIISQIEKLRKDKWTTRAQEKALNIDKLYLSGAREIIKLQQNLV